jgi:predicted dehydrogenase
MNNINYQFGIGIIGCGVIGNKRAKAIGKKAKLIACSDINDHRGKNLAQLFNAKFFDKWQDLIKLPEVDIVIVATPHNSLASITLAAIKLKKHVFVEKPAARSFKELESIIEVLTQSNIKVRVGFNHRYHPAIMKAKQI